MPTGGELAVPSAMMYAETFRWVLEDHILPLDVRVQISLSLSLLHYSACKQTRLFPNKRRLQTHCGSKKQLPLLQTHVKLVTPRNSARTLTRARLAISENMPEVEQRPTLGGHLEFRVLTAG